MRTHQLISELWDHFPAESDPEVVITDETGQEYTIYFVAYGKFRPGPSGSTHPLEAQPETLELRVRKRKEKPCRECNGAGGFLHRIRSRKIIGTVPNCTRCGGTGKERKDG